MSDPLSILIFYFLSTSVDNSLESTENQHDNAAAEAAESRAPGSGCRQNETIPK